MVFIYDGTYEGLLSCIFEIFKTHSAPVAIATESNYQATLLDNSLNVSTNDELAVRVVKGIDQRTDSLGSSLLYKLFLSELPEFEMLVYQVVAAIVQKGDASILENFANPFILRARQIEKMIHREVHRMHAFVRFQKSRDGLFYAAIDPDFNVLPLIGDHFEKRYADQCWLILDTRRHYGIYYDLEKISFISSDDSVFSISAIHNCEQFQDEKEQEYQALWKNYFHAVNIQERKNERLHLRHMPKRYWKYLTEKMHH